LREKVFIVVSKETLGWLLSSVIVGVASIEVDAFIVISL